MICLFSVSLIERFRTNLEAQVFHEFEDMVCALESDNLLIAYSVVALLVVEIE